MARKKHTGPITFSASAVMPDGRVVSVTLSVPQSSAAAKGRDLLENTEIAQIAVARVLENWRRGDVARAQQDGVPF